MQNMRFHATCNLESRTSTAEPGSQGPGTKIQSPVVSRIQRPEPSVHDQER